MACARLACSGPPGLARPSPRRPSLRWLSPRLPIGLTVAALALAAAPVESVYRVSQKGRAFRPGTLLIRANETVAFVNDDGDLLHHAYLEGDHFSFDTGDQEPGSIKTVIFPTPGTYTVLCGIHPKMRLQVRVQ